MTQISAGIVLYRLRDEPEVLIAHPGGPFFAGKHAGAWSIPKGLLDGEEDPHSAARREWEEETGFALPDGPWLDLGTTRLRSGKQVHAWAVAGDLDPGGLVGNTFEIEWPPRSGRHATFPEIDELRWCAAGEAAELLNPAQVVFVQRLLKILQPKADD